MARSTQDDSTAPPDATPPPPLRRYMPRGSRQTEIATVGELLHWSYASLAAATAAEQRGLTSYDVGCWMIRAKLFKGLRQGTMKLGTLFADVREMPSDRCAYCSATAPPKLHADHLIPRHRGGPESADNLVWACRSCNSSKCARDLLERYASRDAFPPLILIRRYLKLAISEAQFKGCMDSKLAESPPLTFSLEHLPTYYPLVGEVDDPEDDPEHVDEARPAIPTDPARREIFTIGQKGLASPASLQEVVDSLGIEHIIDLRGDLPSRGMWSQPELTKIFGSRLVPSLGDTDLASMIATLPGRILALGAVKDPGEAPGRLDLGDQHPEWEVVHIHHRRHKSSPVVEAQCIAHRELVAALRERPDATYTFFPLKAYSAVRATAVASVSVETPGVA